MNQVYINRIEAEFIDAGMPNDDNWYQEAHTQVKRLAEKHNIDFNVCAAVVAALSPRIRWKTKTGKLMNLIAADILIKGYRHKQAKAKVFSTIPGFNKNKEKAWKILRTGDPTLCTGRKVWAFYNNIINPECEDFLTVDSWIFAIAEGLDYSADKENFVPNLTEHRDIVSALRFVAAKYGVHPVPLQSAIWKSAKRKAGI